MSRPVSWKLNLAMLWFSQLVILAGFQALIPFVPLFIKNELGIVDEAELAFAVSAFNFFGTMAYAIFNPIWGVLADRFGVKPMLLRGTFLTGIFFPLMAYSNTVFLLVVLRFISAACAGTTAASQMMIVRNTPDEHQGFALGVLTTAIWGGAMLGYVIGGLLIHYFDYTMAFWVCGALYLLGGISILFTRDGEIHAAPVKKHHDSNGLSFLIPKFSHAVWIMLGLFFLLGIIRTFEVAYIALKVEELTSAETAALWTGITSAAVCAAAIISGVVSGYLVDRLPAGNILIPVMLISAVALVLQGWADNLWCFAAGRVLLYIAAGGLQPVLQKVLSSVTAARKRGAVFGFASSCQSCGGMTSAVLSGIVMTCISVSGVFYVAALCFLIALPICLYGISNASRPFKFHRA
ncbi:MAG: multidrug efflux MFS transporter [Lentisphaerae bacterium]|nr:multidrug efflux MFS transporter [Lentisphaerota bacterium]